MPDLALRMNEIAGLARERKVALRRLLSEADVAPSNWARWKAGKTSPTFNTWRKIEDAAERLLASPTEH